MKNLFTIISICLCICSFAQPPGIDDSIMAIKRKWTKKPPFVHAYDAQLKPAQFPLIYKNTDAIAATMLQTFPEVNGAEPSWYVSITGKPYFNGGPSPYQYNALFKYYFYSNGLKKISRHQEPFTGATFYVNGFRFLLQETGLATTINGQQKTMYEVCNTDGEWKGYPVYRINDNTYKNYQMVLLTKNGRLPWKPVSQLQYLQAYRSMRLNETKAATDDLDKGIAKAKKDIEKIKSDKQYANATGETVIATYQKTLDVQLAKRDANIKLYTDILEKDVKKLEDYIDTTPKEILQQPAVVKLNKGHKIWNGFADASDKDAQKIVYINEDYFDKSLPVYEPQFITLAWYWMDATASLHFKQIFEKDYPVEKLQGMIISNKTNSETSTLKKDRIKKSIDSIVHAVKGTNTPAAWAATQNQISNYLILEWKEGKLRGTTTSEAFYVKADQTTMTQSDIAAGRLVVEVGIAFIKPAEFEILRFQKQL